MRLWIGALALCGIFIGGAASADEIVVNHDNIFSLKDTMVILAPAFADPDDPQGRLQIYGNGLARQAFEQMSAQAPAGAVFVNEKTVSGKIDAVGVMVRRAAGFDAAHGDWEYFFANQWGDYRSGKLDDCTACHRQAKSPDFVFYPRTPPKPAAN